MSYLRYKFIDVTRAVAAWAVVVSHAQQILIDRPLPPGAVHRVLSMVTTIGHQAVVVFFVLSGFWIVRSVDRAGNSFDYRNYLLSRFTRLTVVLYPALLLGAGFDLLGMAIHDSPLYAGTQGSVSLTQDVSDQLSPGTFLGNMLFGQDIFVRPLGSNGPLWSIAVEFWYYVYFPLAWMAVRSRRIVWIALAAAGLAILPSAPLFLCWLSGGLVYVIAERGCKNREFPPIVPAGALGIFALAVVGLKLVPLSEAVEDVILVIPFGVFLATGMRSRFGDARGLGALARFGAQSSYSLYATHMPLVVLLCNFVVPDHRMTAGPLTWALMVALTVPPVLLAIGFSRVTEARTAAVRNWLARQVGPVRASAAAG